MNATSSTVPVVLITGALTGIGQATVLAFARFFESYPQGQMMISSRQQHQDFSTDPA